MSEESVEIVALDSCSVCGKTFGIDCERSNANRDVCKECAPGLRRDITKSKQDNSGWMDVAREEGIPLWEQQPGESNEEFSLWCSYQELWPGVRPTVSKVAKAVEVSASTVQRAYNKWTWGARLQAWIREVTAERTAELRTKRREMVDDHVTMGEMMRAKAMEAIEAFDPADVTPNELVAILKETQRLESTSRDMLDDIERATASDIDGYTPVDAPYGLFEDGDGEFATPTRGGLDASGMQEVVEILLRAGALKGVAAQTNVALVVDDEL